jgi:hypothetical protein
VLLGEEYQTPDALVANLAGVSEPVKILRADG